MKLHELYELWKQIVNLQFLIGLTSTVTIYDAAYCESIRALLNGWQRQIEIVGKDINAEEWLTLMQNYYEEYHGDLDW